MELIQEQGEAVGGELVSPVWDILSVVGEEAVAKVIRTRVTPSMRKNPSQSLLLFQSYFLDFVAGKFVDDKFPTYWLDFYRITNKTFAPYVGKPEACSALFTRALRHYCQVWAAGHEPPETDLAAWVFNRQRFTSRFLLHALKVSRDRWLSPWESELKMATQAQLNALALATQHPIEGRLIEVLQWYSRMITALRVINVTTWEHSPLRSLDQFVGEYLSYIPASAAVSPADIGVVGRYWQAFVCCMKLEYNVTLDPNAALEIANPAIALIQDYPTRKVRPPEYWTTMGWEDRFFWDLEHDEEAQAAVRLRMPRVWQAYTEGSVDKVKAILYGL